MVRSSTKRNRLNSAELPNRTRRNWSELPEELTFQVLSRLGAIDVLTSAQKVCTQWRRMCKHPMVWRTIDMANDHFFHEVHYDLDKMCHHAVDRSFGRVEDINVEYFGTDELLKYITDSSSGIKRLRLAHCPKITDKGLTEVAPKLPLLEDLDFTSCKNISHEPLKVIGSSCPLLKSFKLDTWFKLPEDEVYDDTVFNIEEGEDTDVEVEVNAEVNANAVAVAEVVMDGEMDADALAIAGSMHGLHHLQLFRNELTNDGLSEILDHCPRLESLDLRYCYNLNLKGDLGIKCAERIKRLQLPDNSTDIPKTDLLKKDTVWFTYRSADDVEGHVADVIIFKTIDFTDDYEW
ncbi:putative F-box/LRR-repeat protein 23 [Rosa rugosa]|uniref:putative F-box/LRR-repeat protein 23 n=1 Tax=Rosa rugosa TaxID=74645 RepID=UPI002B40AE71|nr:putative F-box/LRR-repeat protein 23 [Rosa rugosa]